MWQYASKLGITRLYGQAGDKCVVQYYGVESKYPASVLTEGETATFAGLSANTTTGRVNNMSLDIEVGEGEDLEIGVKSGYGLEANKTAGANHGKFYVDLVRTWKVSDLPVTFDENASDNVIVPRAYNNKVVLNKTFKNGEWQYVCLPFSLNANDIETIFGKGTKTLSNSPLKGENSGELSENEASPLRGGLVGSGVPFLVCPTDVLPSPIILENVRIETDTPQAVTADGKIITGTFQRTGDVPAFSAIVTEDPDGIGEVKSEKLKVNNEETSWYDLGGSRVPFPAKGGIYVTKGRSVLK